MHFCNKCDNMYYIKISAENSDKLLYYCRNCGNEDNLLNKDNICVSKTYIRREEQTYSHIINKYTKFDPTLPRINTIKCPSATCLSNTDEVEKEVIYIRYDDINMKYIYLCANCNTIWKTSEQI